MPEPIRPVDGQPRYTLGVVCDTHIPDRLSEIHPQILPIFEAAHVTRIIHAGDICAQRVLDQLAEVAPVTAVRGNRDLALRLPLLESVTVGGVCVGVMHGHGGWIKYFQDKIQFLLYGYNLHRYLKLLTTAIPEANVVIFGHTHHPEILWHRGKLLFNPGSASFGFKPVRQPSVGLLHIYPGGKVKAEIQFLHGYTLVGRKWVKTS